MVSFGRKVTFGVPLTLVLLSTLSNLGVCERILLIPAPFVSHMRYFGVVAGELRATYQHQLYVLLPENHPNMADVVTWNVSIVTHQVTEGSANFLPTRPSKMDREFMELLLNISQKGSLWGYNENREPNMPMCTNPLSDRKLVHKLRDLNLDLAVLDGDPTRRCIVILVYRLGLPFVLHTTHFEPWLFRNPALPSFVPIQVVSSYTDMMTFSERIGNIVQMLRWLMLDLPYLRDSLVTRYASEMAAATLNFLTSNSKLWLVNSNPVLNYPRPRMPNMVEVGGLTTRPGHKLEPDLENFVSNTKILWYHSC